MKKRGKRGKSKKATNVMVCSTQATSGHAVAPEALAQVLIDLWRIKQRANKDQASERVLVACERAEERLKKLGFRLDDHVGNQYDPNMALTVVENEGGFMNRIIVECIAPSVYFKDQLVSAGEQLVFAGEVVTRGEEENGKDS